MLPTSCVQIGPTYQMPRQRMVERLREHYKIADEHVLGGMNTLPRHHFCT